MTEYYFVYSAKIGDIFITYDSNGVTGVYLPYDNLDNVEGKEHKVSSSIKSYFDDYFKGIEPEAVKINIKSTDFQRKVYDVLLSTKMGTILTYGQIAKAIGCASPRAVGQALKKNPIPIIIPCHRVVGTGWNGGFGGETCGQKMDIKNALLEHERKNI
jgi:methylated-DNA-[protein]-cysteine S-methyltransferase